MTTKYHSGNRRWGENRMRRIDISFSELSLTGIYTQVYVPRWYRYRMEKADEHVEEYHLISTIWSLSYVETYWKIIFLILWSNWKLKIVELFLIWDTKSLTFFDIIFEIYCFTCSCVNIVLHVLRGRLTQH